MHTDKQQEVYNYLSSVNFATLQDIYSNVSFGYYHNWQKHLGALMGRMVRNGLAVRIKPGVYKGGAPAQRNTTAIVVPRDHPRLF